MLTAICLQMELKALKDQLAVERQLWEASCAKKEVGVGAARGRAAPGSRASASGSGGRSSGSPAWLLGLASPSRGLQE